MTPDELSEFAEMLWSACDEACASGCVVAPRKMTRLHCCPLGAAVGGDCFPNSITAGKRLGVTVIGFTAGFDGHRPFMEPGEEASYGALHSLGLLFREAALAGTWGYSP